MRVFAAHSPLARLFLGLSLGALTLAVSVSAHADKVHLHSGSVLEGKATRQGDKVVVQLESGSIRLDAASVARIEPSVTPLEQIARLRGALANDAIAERIELANMCRTAQLSRCERELLEEVITRDENHAEARLRLGYVRSEAGWITREEQRARRAQGLDRERKGRVESERALARAEVLRDTAELAKKQAELAVERERLLLQKAQLEQQNEATRSAAYLPYFAGYALRPPTLLAPHAAPYMINGVRAPSEAGFNIPGVRSPQSYFR